MSSGDHRYRTDQPRELHDVGADTADAPHTDRLSDRHLAGPDDGAERSRDRVGQDRGLLEWNVVGHPGQACCLSNGVFGPRSVIRKSHQLDPQAIHHVTASAVRAGLTGSAGGDHHPVAFGPAGHVGAEFGDGARGFVALGHHRSHGREGAVDQTQVRMADPAEGDLDQNFAGTRFRNRNIFQRNSFGVSVEALGPHGGCHGYSTPMVTSVDLMNTVAG